MKIRWFHRRVMAYLSLFTCMAVVGICISFVFLGYQDIAGVIASLTPMVAGFLAIVGNYTIQCRIEDGKNNH